MGIKRNEVAEPQWTKWDYAVISKEDLFSGKRWRETPDWNIILKQVEKTRQASQMIDIRLYPSKLFFAALDLLEANLYMIDDMFYYLTGMRLIGTTLGSEVQNVLGFWSMDSYKVLEQIEEGLIQAKAPLIECLKQEPLWDISLKVIEKHTMSKHAIGTFPIPVQLIKEECVYTYAREHYEADQIDQEALADQIANILELAGHYAFFFLCIYGDFFDFPKLLALFRQSKKAQNDYIEPWRHDFGGTRDSLIAKMEKDPKLRPWVHRYDHLSKKRTVPSQLFFDEKDIYDPVNKDECFNTDNWIAILTIAAVLQEYDEQHGMSTPTATKPNLVNDEIFLTKLSIFIPNEVVAKRFVEAVSTMNDRGTLALVKRYQERGLCLDTPKALYDLLYEAGLYTAGYSNWSAQISPRTQRS